MHRGVPSTFPNSSKRHHICPSRAMSTSFGGSYLLILTCSLCYDVASCYHWSVTSLHVGGQWGALLPIGIDILHRVSSVCSEGLTKHAFQYLQSTCIFKNGFKAIHETEDDRIGSKYRSLGAPSMQASNHLFSTLNFNLSTRRRSRISDLTIKIGEWARHVPPRPDRLN